MNNKRENDLVMKIANCIKSNNVRKGGRIRMNQDFYILLFAQKVLLKSKHLSSIQTKMPVDSQESYQDESLKLEILHLKAFKRSMYRSSMESFAGLCRNVSMQLLELETHSFKQFLSLSRRYGMALKNISYLLDSGFCVDYVKDYDKLSQKIAMLDFVPDHTSAKQIAKFDHDLVVLVDNDLFQLWCVCKGMTRVGYQVANRLFIRILDQITRLIILSTEQGTVNVKNAKIANLFRFIRGSYNVYSVDDVVKLSIARKIEVLFTYLGFLRDSSYYFLETLRFRNDTVFYDGVLDCTLCELITILVKMLVL